MAKQEVDVSDHAVEIDAGGRFAHLSGWFFSADGTDHTTAHLAFIDAEGTEIGASEPIGPGAMAWTEAVDEAEIPVGTHRIDVVLERTGGGSGSFVDDLSLALGPPGALPCAADWPLPEEEDEGGCEGCAGGPRFPTTAFPVLLALLLALWRMRCRRSAAVSEMETQAMA
ncbi:MAG: hypothetical protein JRJ84_21720 [Deltaproteobacteria bacterium]|nr:hypothetical protein [Deltaproteobacteria bacterium]